MQKNNPYGFTGQRFEPELRMYSFAYRTYNPMSMRWMTPDSIRDGTNWYQYCMSDPVNLWDPLGMCDEGVGENINVDPFYKGKVGIDVGVLDVQYDGETIKPEIKLVGGEIKAGDGNLGANAFLYNPSVKIKIKENDTGTLYLNLGFYVGVGVELNYGQSEIGFGFAKGFGGEFGLSIEAKEYNRLPAEKYQSYQFFRTDKVAILQDIFPYKKI